MAFQQFFGEDLTRAGVLPITGITNSLAALATFRAAISNPVVETLESYAAGTVPPLVIAFSGSSGSITATLSGGAGVVANAPGGSNAGRYSVVGATGTTGTKYWNMELTASPFVLALSVPVLAMGFFATDVSDYGGQLQVNVYNGASLLRTISVPHTIGVGASTDGSCFFYGFIHDVPFSSVTITNTAGSGDSYGLDGFTIADSGQVNGSLPNYLPGSCQAWPCGASVI